MSTRTRPPAFRTLTAFARGYLHQDYVDEYGDARGAAVAFAQDAGAKDAARLRGDLERLITLSHDWPIARVRAFITETLGAQWHLASRRDLAAMTQALTPETRRGRT
jgi:hypothetical protein